MESSALLQPHVIGLSQLPSTSNVPKEEEEYIIWSPIPGRVGFFPNFEEQNRAEGSKGIRRCTSEDCPVDLCCIRKPKVYQTSWTVSVKELQNYKGEKKGKKRKRDNENNGEIKSETETQRQRPSLFTPCLTAMVQKICLSFKSLYLVLRMNLREQSLKSEYSLQNLYTNDEGMLTETFSAKYYKPLYVSSAN